MRRMSISFAFVAFLIPGQAVSEDSSTTKLLKELQPRLKPRKIEKGDSALLTLQKERYNFALEAVQLVMERFVPAGKEPLQFVLDALERMVLAGLDIESDPKSRIAILEESVRLSKLIEGWVKAEFEAGKTTIANIAIASSARRSAEIRLLKEKEGKKR
jgi:hypothetical protein